MSPFFLLAVAFLSASLLTSTVSGGFGPETVENFSGYIDVRNQTHHLFYWFFESRNEPASDPFVLWMTGGPGCSGLLAVFFENGPYYISDTDLSLSLNPYSWNTKANVLWIDQPVGAGFSYGDLGTPGVISETQMAEDMYEFLQKFLRQNPKYANLEFFVTGESYAGHYIPALSAFIERANQNLTGDNLPINLQGLAIGNGLVDPTIQYQYYAPFAYEHSLVDTVVYDLMKVNLAECIPLIKACQANSSLGYLACINAYDVCNLFEIEPPLASGVNPYDVREQCQIAPLCYNFTNITTLLGQPAVKKALGVSPTRIWQECNRFTEFELVLAGDWMKSYAVDIPFLLENGKRVLVYAGAEDFICNWLGNSEWVLQLDWNGKSHYDNSPNQTWIVDQIVSGSFKSADGLTFLKVNNAGHMVPHDQPISALDMINRFLSNSSFST